MSTQLDRDVSRRQRSEARAIRSIIEDWRARPLPSGRTKPWRIAVLARARSHFAAIAAELSGATGRAPIPYRAIKIDALHDRPEVLDALALTRALVHPADRAAWLAILRAPWCGLSLTDLLRLTGEGDNANHELTVPELIDIVATVTDTTGPVSGVTLATSQYTGDSFVPFDLFPGARATGSNYATVLTDSTGTGAIHWPD